MKEVVIPSLGQSGMDVTIETWFKAVGDSVKQGEALFEISNEKLTQEIQSPVEGVLKSIHKQEGDTAAVGELVAEIE